MSSVLLWAALASSPGGCYTPSYSYVPYRTIYRDRIVYKYRFVGVPVVQVPTYSAGYAPYSPLSERYLLSPAQAGPQYTPAQLAGLSAQFGASDPCQQRLAALQQQVATLTAQVQQCQKALAEAQKAASRSKSRKGAENNKQEQNEDDEEEPDEAPAEKPKSQARAKADPFPRLLANRCAACHGTEKPVKLKTTGQEVILFTAGRRLRAELSAAALANMIKQIDLAEMPPADNIHRLEPFTGAEKKYVLARLQLLQSQAQPAANGKNERGFR